MSVTALKGELCHLFLYQVTLSSRDKNNTKPGFSRKKKPSQAEPGVKGSTEQSTACRAVLLQLLENTHAMALQPPSFSQLHPTVFAQDSKCVVAQ